MKPKFSPIQKALMLGLGAFAATVQLCSGPSLAQDTAPVSPVPSVRPRIALALGGGGAKAAGHVGVLRVFEREHIPIDCIAGTSVGSAIGALYATGMPLADIEKLVVDGELRKAILPSIPKIIGAQLLHKATFWKHYPAGLVTANRYRRFLNKYWGSERRIEEMNMPFIAVATDLIEGKEFDMAAGNLTSAVVASSSLSPLLKPQRQDDKLLADGGMVANLPIKAAKKLGAEIVVAVCVDTTLRPIPPKRLKSFGKLTGRVADIYCYAKDQADIQGSDMTIWANEDAVKLTDTKRAKLQYAISQGERAAMQAVPYLKQMLERPTILRTATNEGDHSSGQNATPGQVSGLLSGSI